jgi:hypothetical protein
MVVWGCLGGVPGVAQRWFGGGLEMVKGWLGSGLGVAW